MDAVVHSVDTDLLRALSDKGDAFRDDLHAYMTRTIRLHSHDAAADLTSDAIDRLGRFLDDWHQLDIFLKSIADANDKIFDIAPDLRSLEITHTVVSGDTLSEISLRYLGDASRSAEIAALNNISNPNTIDIGDVLILPPGAATTVKPSPQSSPTPPSTQIRQQPITRQDLHNLLRNEGFTDEYVNILTWIARAESSLRPSARNDGLNVDGSVDHGLFGINERVWYKHLKRDGIISQIEDLYDPATNVRAVKYILNSNDGGGWRLHRGYGRTRWEAGLTEWSGTWNRRHEDALKRRVGKAPCCPPLYYNCPGYNG